MGNYYHLSIHTPKGNLGRAIRHINEVYTQRFNRMQRRDGPLFRGRYKAIVIDADSYHLSLTRYIHRNPVEMRKPLVTRLEDYPWSSYPAYLNLSKPPDWLYRDFTYAALGRRDRFRGYRQFVELGVDEELSEFFGRERRSPILGSDVFRERLIGARTVVSAEVPHGELAQSRDISHAAVVDAVAREFGVNAEQLYQRSSTGRAGANPARAIAMLLCQEHTSMTQPDIGKVFGGMHYSAVAQAVRRIRLKVQSDQKLFEQIGTVRATL